MDPKQSQIDVKPNLNKPYIDKPEQTLTDS
jgi:hypothetical protein